MADEQSEAKRLDAGFRVILLIWGAILSSLGAYLVLSLVLERSQEIGNFSNLPVQPLKYVLFGISFATLFLVYILRKFLMKPGRPAGTNMPSNQHPAVARYMTVTLISSAVLESIGIYGLVLFLLVKDRISLYQLLIISALGMIYFRPRKDELLRLAETMKEE